MKDLVKSIDAILPQTQCTQCGFNGCLPYAEAIAKGTPHNQCPPGGKRVIEKLSALLHRPVLPLNPHNGVEKPKFIARIKEADCIGCTKCIQACPTDAILGAGKMMHTVIESECTGCGLCVTPCPMDCIDMIEAPVAMQPTLQSDAQRQANSDHSRKRHQLRNARLVRRKAEEKERHALLKNAGKPEVNNSAEAKKAYIQAALARVQMKKLTK
jgi:electron transport complex protein RnfB